MEKQIFLKKIFSFSIGTWLNALISFFTVPITTLLINPSEFGKASMFSTIYTLFLWLILLGTHSAFTRFYFQESNEMRSKLLWNSIYIPLVLSLFLIPIIFSLKKQINIFIAGTPNSNIHVLFFLTVFTGIIRTFSLTILRTEGKGFSYSFLQIISSIATTGFIIVYSLYVERTFYAIIYAQLFSNLTTFFVGLIFEKKYWVPRKIDKVLIKRILKYGYPLALTTILWWSLNWIDRFVLRIYTNFSEIGIYSAAFKIVSVMNLISVGFSNFWEPFSYEQFENNPKNKYVFSKVFDYLTFLMFSAGFLILAFKDIIFLLLAKEYRVAANVSPFLILSPIMLSLNTVSSKGILFKKKTHYFIISNAISTLFNLIGNFILISIYGIKGAAISTGLSFVLIFLIESYFSMKLYPVPYKIKRIYLLTTIFIIVAFINTFTSKNYIALFSSILGLSFILLLYKKIFVSIIREFFLLTKDKKLKR